ncbi:MAG: hypothetical protein IJT44_05950 [Clostridia bacterium]|nr:hypothetical protein [Clostridia bacterium]
MGYGSYTSYDWTKLKTSKKLDASSSVNQIFQKREMDPRFDPRFIGKREARDSDDHPNSTPIILGLDVTGSMGYLSKQIAQESLHETMMKLFSTKPVEDPQIMFAAIGDTQDNAPLQVTQFESDIRIAEQLLDLWLEGRGGDGPEDYPLVWYFAAKHTSIDCFEKHGRKGYIFTIGDADCHEMISKEGMNKVFDDKVRRNVMSAELARKAGAMYEIFHINIHHGAKSEYPKNLESILPGRLLKVGANEIAALPEIIVTTMLLKEGRQLQDVLELWPELTRPTVKKAVADLVLPTKKGIRF